MITNNNMMPETTQDISTVATVKSPSSIRHPIQVNLTKKAFEGFSMQGMKFHQAICEVCDNALAAARPGEKALICVALAPDLQDENYLHLAIADHSSGMDLAELTNALQLGSLPTGSNRLNEHGHGLNNSIGALSGGSPDWCIYSHKKPGFYYCVTGPFDTDMVVEEKDEISLPTGLHLEWDAPSTVIYVHVPLTVARTAQWQEKRQLKNLATLRRLLMEHLGVTYRGFLELDPDTQESLAKISITLGNNSKFVYPISVPMMSEKYAHLELELDGNIIPLEYHYGVLDVDKRNRLLQNDKTHYYYQGNQRSQGIDIRLGHRTISTSMLEDIWYQDDGTPISRHNSYNDFVGELIIPELPRGVLSTLTNKTGINPNDKNWDKVFDLLADYPPQKNGVSLSEKELQHKWMKILKAANPEDTISDEISVWPTSTRIDVVAHNDSGKYEIYELKAGKGDSQNLTQLRMYWDGLVLEGIQPTKGVLLVKDYETDLAEMCRLLNKLPTPLFPDGTQSAPYNLILATHSEKQLV